MAVGPSARQCLADHILDSEHDLTDEDLSLIRKLIAALTWSRETYEFARDKIVEVERFLKAEKEHDVQRVREAT